MRTYAINFAHVPHLLIGMIFDLWSRFLRLFWRERSDIQSPEWLEQNTDLSFWEPEMESEEMFMIEDDAIVGTTAVYKSGHVHQTTDAHLPTRYSKIQSSFVD